MVNNDGLVHPVRDSTELLIQRAINGIQRMISLHNNEGEKEKVITTTEAVIEINLAAKKHWELQIRTLQEAPRDADNLRRLLQIKQRQKEEAMYIEDTQRLVTEMEMLKVVFYLVSRGEKERVRN